MNAMMHDYFASLAAGIERKLAGDPGDPSPRKRYALEIARLGLRLYDDGNPVAWCGVSAPFDLFQALGVTSCFVEFVGAMLASAGAVGPVLEQAEQAGYASDTCAYHRAVVGAASAGMMPTPRFLVGTSAPCSNGLATLENLARLFGRDLFVLHVPESESGRNVAYLADQIRALARFAVDHVGVPLDPERLASVVRSSNQGRGLMAEVFALARHVPSPVGSRDLQNFAFIMALLLGTDAGVNVATAFRDAFAARVAAGKSGAARERIRLLWIQNRIQFKNPLLDLMEERYGAVVVADELNDVTWDELDPADPYPEMARRAITNPLNVAIESRIAHLRRMAAEYRVDGVINPCHWGCRQGTGSRGLVQAGLREAGLPVLNLETDCADPRNFAEGQLRTRLEAFLELCQARTPGGK
jgi:benzoyl-CoA reductase/2-hydroxyglutaryl-CoA dehydratase subunit BcrC/BadD/HgdB